MRQSMVLLRQAAAAAERKGASKSSGRVINSLALTTYFRQPDFGMTKYEVLSRASAFLLSVDPAEPESSESSSPAFSHLAKSEQQRKDRFIKQSFPHRPAGGPKRAAKDLNWLEFCPSNFRPLVHVVAASHVLAPWLFTNYYPHEWISRVQQEHVTYSLDVVVSDTCTSLASFACNPYPIHHPEGVDLAVLHLTGEESALESMKDMGVQLWHLRDADKSFQRGDKVSFHGFKVTEDAYTHSTDLLKVLEDEAEIKNNQDTHTNTDPLTNKETDDDTKIFIPYTATGDLTFFSSDRYLASTEQPLHEGLCGGPVIDTNDATVCGIIEGIVPIAHEDERMAGAASFIPSTVLKGFIDYAEQIMLKNIVPESLFEKVVEIKTGTRTSSASEFHFNEKDTSLSKEGQNHDAESMDKTYDEMISGMKKNHSPQEVDAVLETVERERKEVMKIIEEEGGDLDEIIATVRRRTRETQRELLKELQENNPKNAGVVENPDQSDQDSGRG